MTEQIADLEQENALLKSLVESKEQKISEMIIEKNAVERLFHEAKWLLKYIAKKDLNASAMKLIAENFMKNMTIGDLEEKPDTACLSNLDVLQKVKKSDIHCPFCGRQRWVILKHIENKNGDKTFTMQCIFCNSVWHEVYYLVDVRVEAK